MTREQGDNVKTFGLIVVAGLVSWITACSIGSSEDVSSVEGENVAAADVGGGSGGITGIPCSPPSDGGGSTKIVEFQNGLPLTDGGVTYQGADDTRLESAQDSTNFGTSIDLIVKKGKSSLFRFDLSFLPPGTRLNCASFAYYVQDRSVKTFLGRPLYRPWTEAGATWLSYASGAAWGAPGATSSFDRDDDPMVEVSGSVSGRQSTFLDLAVVQRWIDNPSQNKGFIFQDATANDGMNIASSESTSLSVPTTRDLRPSILLGYTP